MIAALYFYQGDPRSWVIGAIWFQAAYLLDNCDGEVARLTNRTSGFGSWIDTITDCLIHIGFFGGLGCGISRYTGNPVWFRLGLLACGGVLLSYLTFVAEQVQIRGRAAWIHPDPPQEEALKSFWKQLRKLFREDFSFVVLGSALVQQMAWLLWSGIAGSFLIGFASLLSITVRSGRLFQHYTNRRV